MLKLIFDWADLQLVLNCNKVIPISFVFPELMVVILLRGYNFLPQTVHNHLKHTIEGSPGFLAPLIGGEAT